MKTLIRYLIFLVPAVSFASNPPAPGLRDEPVAVPIDSMLFVLFTAGIIFGGFVIFKKK